MNAEIGLLAILVGACIGGVLVYFEAKKTLIGIIGILIAVKILLDVLGN